MLSFGLIMSVRLNGPSEKFGDTSLSNTFSTFEIGEPTSPKKQIIRKMGRGSLVLDAGKYFMLPEHGLHATFIEREDFGVGREDSRHVVRFGQLILNGPGVHESPDFVAVKPFDDKRELYNEWAANTYVNSVFDDQRAFMPLGVVRDKHGDTSMLSLYEHGVKTADTIFWADKESQPEALREKVIERAAMVSMYSLGLLHGARLIHGDAQAKNLGWDNRHARFVDLESSLLVPKDAVDQPEFTNKFLKDVTMFIQSTMQVEENEDQIASALRKPEVVSDMLESYSAGVVKARLRQDASPIPNYAILHEEAIRHTIDKTFK
jgi:hypothetical protein